jgi:hypothetical protein
MSTFPLSKLWTITGIKPFCLLKSGPNVNVPLKLWANGEPVLFQLTRSPIHQF